MKWITKQHNLSHHNASKSDFLFMQKPKVIFSILHFVLVFYFFPLMNTLIYLCKHKTLKHIGPGNFLAKKKYVLRKRAKFWSVTLELFFEHKLWNCEELNKQQQIALSHKEKFQSAGSLCYIIVFYLDCWVTLVRFLSIVRLNRPQNWQKMDKMQ